MKLLFQGSLNRTVQSLPLRERGLKSEQHVRKIGKGDVAPLAGAWIEIVVKINISPYIPVAPLAGAWIEIVIEGIDEKNEDVAPLAGAWIEIRRDRMTVAIAPTSLPLRERGLKSPDLIIIYIVSRRSPCGSVD